MNAENNQALQGEIENPLVDAGDGVQQVIVDGLYILTNEKARTLLNLSGGMHISSFITEPKHSIGCIVS